MVEVEKIVEKPVIVKEIEYVDKFIDRYRELEDWQSVEQFLAMDNTDSKVVFVADNDGVIRLNGQCEDVAFQLRTRAETYGKRLETEALTKSEVLRYYGHTDMYYYDLHVVCKAIIGNEIWYIEPSNDKVWFRCYLD